MKHADISPMGTGHKIARWGSVAFMVLAWLFLAGLWIWVVVRAWVQSYIGSWGFGAYFLLALYLFVLAMIPVQVIRYFRPKKN